MKIGSGQYVLSGNGTKETDIKFSHLKFGIDDGLRIQYQTESEDLPRINEVILKMAYNQGSTNIQKMRLNS